MTSAMKPPKHSITASILFFTACILLSRTAPGAEPIAATTPEPFVLHTEIRAQGADLKNGDLGTDGDSNIGDAALEARFQLTANINKDDLFFWEGRGVASAGRGGFESADTGAISNGKSFLEWRQSYLQFNNIGDQPFSVTAGRQKLREPYGLWWNENFDALRASYNTTSFAGSIAGGENLFTYRTNGSDFANDKDVARFLAEGSWQYYYENFFETRLLYQNDHSAAHVGDTESTQNPDFGASDLVWGGVRAAGRTHFMASGEQKLAYRADLMMVGGHEDLATISPLGVVTAVNDRHVIGWGFDAATDIPIPHATPLIHLGYAYGSGDGDTADGTDHAFRQDGLYGNFSRIGALSENTDNYGTVLRPQLSNIHILSAGVTMPILQASDIGAIYRYYRLADAATSLMSSGIENTLNGTDKDLGQGIDLLFNADILKEAHLAANSVSDVSFRSSLGFFRAGKAYGPGDGDIAARGLVEVRVGF